MKKQRFFTLIEVMVSMGLAMGVLVALMGFYAYVSHLGKLGKDQEKIAFRTLYIQARLADILPRTVPSYQAHVAKNKEIKSEYNFFTTFLNGNPALTFLFSGDVSLDPVFSGNNLAKLYVNANRQLCLAILPSPLQWHLTPEVPARVEILMENVDRISFGFFVPLDADRSKMWANLKVPKSAQNSLAMLPEGQWVEEWRNDLNKLPPLMRMEIVKGKETIKFIFPLSKSEYMVVYE